MSNPSVFECIYEAVLDFVVEASEFVNGTKDAGSSYIQGVGKTVHEQQPKESIFSQWMPKVTGTVSQTPVNLTRSAVLGALRGGCINFVRIGGISGFLAVALSAYAAHAFAKAEQNEEADKDENDDEGRSSGANTRSTTRQSTHSNKTQSCDEDDGGDQANGNGNGGKQFSESDKKIFYTANLFHFVHSLALLGTPVYKCPNLTGLLFTSGMVMFCGSCYMRVFTGNKDVNVLTPYGGVLLLIGWLTMIF